MRSIRRRRPRLEQSVLSNNSFPLFGDRKLIDLVHRKNKWAFPNSYIGRIVLMWAESIAEEPPLLEQEEQARKQINVLLCIEHRSGRIPIL